EFGRPRRSERHGDRQRLPARPTRAPRGLPRRLPGRGGAGPLRTRLPGLRPVGGPAGPRPGQRAGALVVRRRRRGLPGRGDPRRAGRPAARRRGEPVRGQRRAAADPVRGGRV
ncbi:MAG: hypothetical protein AVDCRST_MAG48-3809, partial [uncultured Friedmanniella sp.]